MKKFEGVKIEKDTKVFSTQYIKVKNYDCRHEGGNGMVFKLNH